MAARRLAAVVDRFVPVRQGKLFAREWNPVQLTKAEPIVLLHDSLGCVELWRDFPEQLAHAAGRKVIAYDRLGYGRSDARLEDMPLTFIQDESSHFLPAVLDSFKASKFVLFGHSVGGPMAAVAASNLADSCIAVVTESGQAFVEERTLQGVREAKANFAVPQQLERLKRYHGEKAEWVVRAWTDTWLDPRYLSWTVAGDLPGIKSPLLVIHGDLDEFGSPKQPQMYCDLGRGEMHLLQKCGHVPHREQTDVVLNILTQFFKANGL